MTDDFFAAATRDWSGMEAALFVDMTLHDQTGYMLYDTNLQARYHAALYDFDGFAPGERKIVMDDLRDYLRDNYDVELNDVFDWDAYRDDISDDL